MIDIELAVDFQQQTTPNDVVSVIATRPLTGNERCSRMARASFAVFDQGLMVDPAKYS